MRWCGRCHHWPACWLKSGSTFQRVHRRETLTRSRFRAPRLKAALPRWHSAREGLKRCVLFREPVTSACGVGGMALTNAFEAGPAPRWPSGSDGLPLLPHRQSQIARGVVVAQHDLHIRDELAKLGLEASTATIRKYRPKSRHLLHKVGGLFSRTMRVRSLPWTSLWFPRSPFACSTCWWLSPMNGAKLFPCTPCSSRLPYREDSLSTCKTTCHPRLL